MKAPYPNRARAKTSKLSIVPDASVLRLQKMLIRQNTRMRLFWLCSLSAKFPANSPTKVYGKM